MSLGYDGANAFIDGVDDNSLGGANRLLINYYSGNEVFIGTGPTKADVYLGKDLFVCGTIRAEELIIEVTGCDFVFDETYPLPSLKERKVTVLKQKHLPNVAPAEDMQQGAALGETMMGIGSPGGVGSSTSRRLTRDLPVTDGRGLDDRKP